MHVSVNVKDDREVDCKRTEFINNIFDTLNGDANLVTLGEKDDTFKLTFGSSTDQTRL